MKRNVVFSLSAAGFFILFVMLSKVCSENVWLVRAFDVDESWVVSDLKTMLDQKTWKPLNYIYGSAHPYLSILLAKGWSFVGETSFANLCVISRLVNALALLGSGFLILHTQLKEVNPRWGFLFLLTLFFAGTNFSYALNGKPELLQAFFVVSALIAFKGFLDRPTNGSLFLAGLLSGMAFATKYAGMLLLAFLIACILVNCLLTKQPAKVFRLFSVQLMVVCCGALLGVALLGPYLLLDFAEVSEMLGFHSATIGKGYLFLARDSWQEWLNMLFSRDVFWWGLAACLVPGLLLKLTSWRAEREDWLPRFVLAFWVIFYLLYLLVMVRERAPRYLIIALPFCYLFVFQSLAHASNWLTERGYRRGAAVLFLVSLLGVFHVSFNGTSAVAKGLLERVDSPRVIAGEWLSANASHDRGVISDLYTYVPPEFSRQLRKAYLTADDVILLRPDYLVVSRTIMSRYLTLERADDYREGRDAYMRHYTLYAGLSNNRFAGYRLLKDFGEVLIFRAASISAPEN